MLYAVKIGNSTVEVGKFENPEERVFYHLGKFELSCGVDRLSEFLNSDLKVDCVLCSVVRELSLKFTELFKNSFRQILNVTYDLKTGLSLKVLNPSKFGNDRLACAVAAYEIYGGDCAVVDAGTATTITVVTSNGDILGGAILPGLETMNRCLHEKTDALPLISIQGAVSALGRDTEEAIRSGIVLGTVFAVQGIIGRISEELKSNMKIILTGGNGSLLSKYLSTRFFFEPYLVFEGMRLIYLKNTKN